jgi:hypothetical protein
MAMIGMIVGIAVARYVIGIESYLQTFPVAMIGWFMGLLLGSSSESPEASGKHNGQ